MIHAYRVLTLMLGLCLMSSMSCRSGEEVTPELELRAQAVGEAAAAALMKELKAHLQEALEGGDLEAAFEACAVLAQPLTAEVQEDLPAGVGIKRTSAKFRNPDNEPDAWERQALEFFTRELAATGVLPGSFLQVMEEDGSFRYYKALTVGELCLKCHGPLEDLEPDVRRSLRENYPGDLALGYALGDFRGSIRVAIPREAADQGEVVFLGNSITYGGDWNGMFPSLLIKNRGISGDVTQGVLDRLDRVLETRPAKIFLMIGINDLAFGRNEEEILANIKRIIREIRQGSPETILYLQSLLPVNPDYPVFSNHTDKGLQIKNINRVLRRMAGDYGAVFVDLYPLFVGQDDKLDPRYTKDGLHLTAAGYSVWEKAVAPHLE